MPQGDKSSYTDKQKRQAQHIEDSAKKSGKSSKRAAQIAYATVNKQDGGGKKSGSGRGTAKKTAAKKSNGASHGARSMSAQKRASSQERRVQH